MRDTLLLDLDGTLLPLNMGEFATEYFSMAESSECLKELCEDKERAYEMYTQAVHTLISNEHPTKFNEDAFYDALTGMAKIDRQTALDIMTRMQDEIFEHMRKFVYPSPYIPKTIDMLKEKGYRLVVATNPIFDIRYVSLRLKWAGVDESDFEYITHCGNSKLCKPDLRYYIDILEALELSAEQCYMVGNDTEEDACAQKLGIDVYLLDEHMVGSLQTDVKYKGGYRDFYEWVLKLPRVVDICT